MVVKGAKGAVRKERVWILGSGFSRSLGGPLLNDLLSHRGEAYVRTKFPKFDRAVYELYRAHLRDAPESNGKPIYWDHAEEFIDFLNTASLNGGSRARYDILVDLLYPKLPRKGALSRRSKVDLIKPLRDDALRCLAAECLFTSHSDPASEAWKPYLKWGSKLDKHDTVISFNYDVVLESLGDYDKKLKFGNESVVCPGRSGGRKLEREVPLLKLHGSVSWNQGDRSFAHSYAHSSMVRSLERKQIPLIATPGPYKLALRQSVLWPLWEKAEEALREASTIIFMGYRFPPSDSESREVLLRAINNNKSRTLKIHTVLGPRTDDDDTVRLRKLLEHSMRQAFRQPLPKRERSYEGDPKFFGIESHPLYVEDFMTVMYDWMLA